jgi:hypothetical protein
LNAVKNPDSDEHSGKWLAGMKTVQAVEKSHLLR